MANNPDPSMHPNWRLAVRPVERRSGTGPLWRRGAEESQGRRPRGTRSIRTAMIALAFAVCGTALIWVCSWLRPPRPATLILIGAGYEENLAVPPNVYGREGLVRFAELTQPDAGSGFWGDHAGRLVLGDGPRILRAGARWDKALDEDSGPTVFLVLALHGGADGRGAYLLPDDAGAGDNPDARLRLTQVLDRLATLPAEQNKVLILDATQVEWNWTLGMLQNGFAPALEQLDPRIAQIPNLVVLSASGLDERSWGCDALGNTVFAHYLIEGLRGAAADREGRIDVAGLYRYTRQNVRRWVGSNLGAIQDPVLLPSGGLGLERARNIELTVVDRNTPPALVPAPVAPDLTAILARWETFQQLKATLPGPQVYTPQLWRRYQDLLLRYDQLARAGAADSAANLALQLDSLARDIQQGRFLDLSSDQNTLAMPAVEGRRPPDPTGSQARLDNLWGKPPPEASRLWAKLQRSPGPDGVPALRFQLLDLLLRRAEEGSAGGGNLDAASELVQVLADPVRPWPAEIQDLIMLHRDRPRNPSPPPSYFDRVAHALRLRRLAEQAILIPDNSETYAYAEQVSSWARAPMAEADRERRLGLDLLFASDAASWEQATTHRSTAEPIYHRAHTIVEEVREALAVRDRVLAILPYYSQWLARPRLAGKQGWTHDDNALFQEVVETLWADTHALVALLESAPQSGRPLTEEQARALGLADRAASVREGLDKFELYFTQSISEIVEIDLPSLWLAIDAALRVPFADTDLRAKLMANHARIEHQFLVETARAQNVVEPPLAPASSLQVTARACDRRQGLMALAVLGQRWFDGCVGSHLETFAQVRDRLAMLDVDPNWRDSLLRAGDQVGYRWWQMPAEIDRQVAASRQAEPAQAEADLRDADRLARLIDGAGSLALTSNPAAAYRRRLVQGLLLWQAQRTIDDHWYAEDPNAEPYYRVAGRLDLDDAARYGLEPDLVQSWRKKLSDPGGLRLEGPSSLVATSERRIGLDYHLRTTPGAEVSPGFPVVWLEPGEALTALEPSAGQRLVRRAGGDWPDPSITCTLQSPLLARAEVDPPRAPVAHRSELTLRGLYRGQQIARSTAVTLYPRPDRVENHHQLPPAASVAIRADRAVLDRFGDGNGAVAIVLDCSGSMGTSSGQSWGPTVKYQEATDALARVLKKVARGTIVSLWVFGQAIGPEKTERDAERTIAQVQAPVAWDPQDPSQLKRLMDRVQYPALEPWNESPIVRTMLMARDDLLNQSGFKTLVVITDGMDNRFVEDASWNPLKKSIQMALRDAFTSADIEINVIGYKVVNQEEERARQQFQVIESLPRPGRFFLVNQSEDLANLLERALRKRLLCWVEQANNVLVPGMSSRGLQIGLDGGGDYWFPTGLAPGGYKVVVNAAGRLESSLAFNQGDLLLLKLVESARGLSFGRVLFSQADYPNKPAGEVKDWRLAVLQNQRQNDGGLQMLVTLERKYDPRETVLELIRPWETWIELDPWPASAAPFALRRSNLSGYPATAWGIDVPDWPTTLDSVSPARPRLRAWWNPDQESPPAGSLDRGPDFEIGSSQGIPPVRIDGSDVQVESVDVEDHLVEVRDGHRETVPCLVVRLGYARGKPVWVRPRGLKPAGYEHRFYQEPGKYTGLFWPVTRDEAKLSLTGLSLIALADFKARAERRGYALELIKELWPPVASDVRPRALLTPDTPAPSDEPELLPPFDMLAPLGAMSRDGTTSW